MEDEKKERKGRAAMLDMYRAANPESGEEIEDEVLFDFADGRHRELSERHEKLNGANQKLAERVGADPRAGIMLNMFAEGNSLPYAIGKTYGREWLDGDLEEFEKGYKENLEMLAKSEADQAVAAKNIEESLARIVEYAKANSLDEDKSNALVEAIEGAATDLLMGNISPGFIDFIYKGLNYDRDVKVAAETGFVEGKNATIDEKKTRRAETQVPDMRASRSRSDGDIRPKEGQRKNIFDDMITV